MICFSKAKLALTQSFSHEKDYRKLSPFVTISQLWSNPETNLFFQSTHLDLQVAVPDENDEQWDQLKICHDARPLK